MHVIFKDFENLFEKINFNLKIWNIFLDSFFRITRLCKNMLFFSQFLREFYTIFSYTFLFSASISLSTKFQECSCNIAGFRSIPVGCPFTKKLTVTNVAPITCRQTSNPDKTCNIAATCLRFCWCKIWSMYLQYCRI